MVSGLVANTNLDDEKQTRQNALNDIENKHLETINSIYNGNEAEELDYEDDPLFAPMYKLDDSVPTTDTTTEEDGIDQA